MPLEPSSQTMIFADLDSTSVMFSMLDIRANKSVKVVISSEAIQRLSNPIIVVEAHRAELARIASDKFDRMGGGSKVTVQEEDLN